MSKFKFFKYWQNNSGGHFNHYPESGIGYAVYVEARDYRQANALAEVIGIYFNGVDNGSDCECCGDRWYRCQDYSRSYTYEELQQEKSDLAKDAERYGLKSYIHYLDGKIEVIE